MQTQLLEPAHRAALSALKAAGDRGFYLAGGTGLCAHLGHRRSFDLDLFCTEPFDSERLVRELGAAGIAFEATRLSPATIHAQVRGVRVSLMTFPYALLETPEPSPEGVPIASLRDIAAMKLEAIASRGARKDFYDIYFICQSGLSLGGALAAFAERFSRVNPDLYHRLRALTFFDDAEQEPEPLLLRPVAWQEVKRFLVGEVRALWAASVGG